jgi:type IV pilus assembly protein PilO
MAMNISLTKLPWYAQVLAFVGLAIAGMTAFYFYYEVPQRDDIAARQAQLRDIIASNQKGYETAKKLNDFRKQVDDLEGRLTSIRAVLPEEKDAADLLRRMQSVAADSNLTIKSFKPAGVVAKQLHAEWPISLELTGTYHDLALFFDRVSKFTRIINISALDIKGDDKGGSGTSIDATCTATTFVLLDKPAAPAPKPGAPTPGKPVA